MLNTIELIGRLVADPEVKVLDDGQKVSTVALISKDGTEFGESSDNNGSVSELLENTEEE